MRSLTAFFVLLVVFMSPGLLVAQGTQPASKTDGSTPAGATKEEVNQLRSEVAAQRKTIEELKAMVQQLVEAKAQPADGNSASVKPVAETGSVGTSEAANVPAADGAHLVNTVLIQPEPGIEAAMINQAKPDTAPKKDAPLAAGWNGEHFFIRSADGQFQLMPYGYVDIDYRAYKGDGAPSATFVIRRARF